MARDDDWQARQEASAPRYESTLYDDTWTLPARMFGAFIAVTLIDRSAAVLDVGCGIRPELPPAVADLCLTNYTGLDPLEGPERSYRFIKAAAEDIPLPDGSIDAVICSSSIDHMPDEDRAVGEMKRVLRPGGRFYWWQGLYDPDTLAKIATYERAARYGALAPFAAAAHAVMLATRMAERQRKLASGERIDDLHERWYTRDRVHRSLDRWGLALLRDQEPPGMACMFVEARAL